MTIHLIRHTSVAIQPGICYGQSDVELAETFEEEALTIKNKISNCKFDKIYSSPLSRCKRLSKFLFDLEIELDDRLMELDFGDWELQKWDKIVHPVYKKWMSNFVIVPCPNGESFLELHHRVKSFLAEIKNKSNKLIAIVTHGGVIRSFLAHINNENLQNAFKREIKYGEIIHLEILD